MSFSPEVDFRLQPWSIQGQGVARHLIAKHDCVVHRKPIAHSPGKDEQRVFPRRQAPAAVEDFCHVDGLGGTVDAEFKPRHGILSVRGQDPLPHKSRRVANGLGYRVGTFCPAVLAAFTRNNGQTQKGEYQ